MKVFVLSWELGGGDYSRCRTSTKRIPQPANAIRPCAHGVLTEGGSVWLGFGFKFIESHELQDANLGGLATGKTAAHLHPTARQLPSISLENCFSSSSIK